MHPHHVAHRRPTHGHAGSVEVVSDPQRLEGTHGRWRVILNSKRGPHIWKKFTAYSKEGRFTPDYGTES